MGIEYIIHQGSPVEFSYWEKIVELNKRIFGPTSVLKKGLEKDGLLTLVALDGEKVVGYKIGYPENNVTFYSWMGGVDPDYRGQGIARELMSRQHEFCREQGYLEVFTKTQNRWRTMLILNLSSGFDIIGCHPDQWGELKIIMIKKLTDKN